MFAHCVLDPVCLWQLSFHVIVCVRWSYFNRKAVARLCKPGWCLHATKVHFQSPNICGCQGLRWTIYGMIHSTPWFLLRGWMPSTRGGPISHTLQISEQPWWSCFSFCMDSHCWANKLHVNVDDIISLFCSAVNLSSKLLLKFTKVLLKFTKALH